MAAPGKAIHSNEMKFSTKDQDNDKWSKNCAATCGDGWWYSNCHHGVLNGWYGIMTDWKYITWYTWKGWWSSLAFSEMKFRKKI